MSIMRNIHSSFWSNIILEFPDFQLKNATYFQFLEIFSEFVFKTKIFSRWICGFSLDRSIEVQRMFFSKGFTYFGQNLDVG
jgi:hypothetical protein